MTTRTTRVKPINTADCANLPPLANNCKHYQRVSLFIGLWWDHRRKSGKSGTGVFPLHTGCLRPSRGPSITPSPPPPNAPYARVDAASVHAAAGSLGARARPALRPTAPVAGGAAGLIAAAAAPHRVTRRQSRSFSLRIARRIGQPECAVGGAAGPPDAATAAEIGDPLSWRPSNEPVTRITT